MAVTASSTVDTWEGCYNDQWQGFCVPDAFAHPAKFAKGLIFRMIDHAMAEGWLRPGDVCADPFGGVALGALPCLLKGIKWIGCELEPKFHDMGAGYDCPGLSLRDFRRWFRRARHNCTHFHVCPPCVATLEASYWNGERPRQVTRAPHRYVGNLDYWQQRYGYRMQGATAWLLQGDSRKLLETIEATGCIVSSPPYGEALSGKTNVEAGDKAHATTRGRDAESPGSGYPRHYGTSPDNLGNLPAGSVDAVISSPPYANGCTYTGGADPHPEHLTGGPLRYVEYTADCVVSSPPYASSTVGACEGNIGGGPGGRKASALTDVNGNIKAVGYGASPGQLGAMPRGEVGAIVTSPPYADRCSNDNQRTLTQNSLQSGHNEGDGATYGSSNGQLGNVSPDTFWAAARDILAQCFALLPPGGHALFVTKPYVRNGSLVPFPDQWRQLCEHVGFVTLHEHQALLSTQHGQEPDLFGGADVTRETRKVSFFRRLAENRGAPRIDAEIVHCMVKPGGTS